MKIKVKELIKMLEHADPDAVVVLCPEVHGGGYAEMNGDRVLMGDGVAFKKDVGICVIDPPEGFEPAVVFYPEL